MSGLFFTLAGELLEVAGDVGSDLLSRKISDSFDKKEHERRKEELLQKQLSTMPAICPYCGAPVDKTSLNCLYCKSKLGGLSESNY